MRKILTLILLFVSLAVVGQGRFPFPNTAHLSTYTSEYQTLLDTWATDPTGDTLNFQNELIDSLINYPSVESPYWDRMDALWVFAQNNSTNAYTNWINPGTNDVSDPGSTEPSFTEWEGFTGNGTDDTLSTNYNPTTDATNYAQDDATFSIYVMNDIGGESVSSFGYNGTNDVYFRPRGGSSTNGYFKLNTTDTYPISEISDSKGLWIVARRASNDNEVYLNGSSAGTSVQVSTGVPNGDLIIFNDGDGSGYSSHQFAIIFIMDGINDTEAAQLNRFFERYMDHLGTGVQ